MKQYSYIGLTIETEEELPFIKINEIEANVQVVSVLFTDVDKKILDSSVSIEYTEQRYIIRYPWKGYYYVSKNRIECCFFDHEVIESTIVNLPMAFCAVLNGILPIHASAVYVPKNENVYLFSGKKGMGKSTLANRLDKEDWCCLFGDDMLGLTVINDTVRVLRGTYITRLKSDSYSVLFQNSNTGLNKSVRYNKYADKYIIYNKSAAEIPLNASLKTAFELSEREDAVSSLTQNIYIMKNIVGLKYMPSNMLIKVRKMIYDMPLFDIKPLCCHHSYDFDEIINYIWSLL